MAQFASHVVSAMHTKTYNGNDHFAKVKGFMKSLVETKGRDVYMRDVVL